jgi:hypothetical protein
VSYIVVRHTGQVCRRTPLERETRVTNPAPHCAQNLAFIHPRAMKSLLLTGLNSTESIPARRIILKFGMILDDPDSLFGFRRRDDSLPSRILKNIM